MAKRRAGTELNADNWDAVEEVEEAGTFRLAPDRDIQTRVIKTAKRRSRTGGDDARKGIFSSFGGFNKTMTSTPTSPFSFLSSMKNGNTEAGASLIMTKDFQKPTEIKTPSKATELPSNHSMAMFQPIVENKPVPSISAQTITPQHTALKYSDEYCTHLKELNQSICEWINQSVEKNPYCILTPIFEDYKKYLSEFDKYKESSSKKREASPSSDARESKKFGNLTQIINKDNSFHGVLTSHSPLFQTPKPSEKLDSKIISPPSINMGQGFSSTPVSKAPSMFSFTQNTSLASTNNFTFGAGQSFMFQNNSAIKEESQPEQQQEDEKEEEDEPPNVAFTPIVEENSVYSMRCKVFVTSKGQYSDRGVGTLYLKPIADSEKYQLIVRADTSLGNLLMNMVLSKSIPAKRMGKNNVLLVTVPTPESKPPPVPVLIRVKTSEEADQLLETLEKHKK